MKNDAYFWLSPLLLAFHAGLPWNVSFQVPPPSQTAETRTADAVALQQLLDRNDYIAYSKAIPGVEASKLTESQRDYFLGMLGFHLGKLDDAAKLLIKGVNINDKSLSPAQVESALEVIGQINLKLCYYGGSAQIYDDIDKAFGSRLGENGQSIRDKRHLGALLKGVPRQTIDFTGDFTLARRGLEYPVSIPNQPSSKPLFAQFDTGAEISVLSASTAKAWGVTMLEGSATLHGYGGGAFLAQPGFLPALMIGKAELHNVAVYVTADSNLYIPEVKRQTNALLGYPVVAALGRLTFSKDGSLTVSPLQPNQTPPVSFNASSTPIARPPAAGRPSWVGATRFDTTISLLIGAPPSSVVSLHSDMCQKGACKSRAVLVISGNKNVCKCDGRAKTRDNVTSRRSFFCFV